MRELLLQKFPILDRLHDLNEPPLTSVDVEELEIVLGVRFPRDYADFLVGFNGGDFGWRVGFSLPDPKPFITGGIVQCLHGEPGDGSKDYGLIKLVEAYNDRLPDDCLIIASCHGQDLVVMRFANEKSEFAGIWFWDSDSLFMGDDTPALHWLADSFDGFLSMLVYEAPEDEEEWESLPLFKTIVRGNFSAVQQYLAEGGAVDARNAKGQTLLMAAIIYVWPRIVRLLLDHSADANARDNQGRTPLHHAARRSIDSVKWLLAAGANAKARDNEGKSVLAEWSLRRTKFFGLTVPSNKGP